MPVISATAILLFASLAPGAADAGPAPAATPAGLQEGRFDKMVQRRVTWRYLLYLPRDHGRGDSRWPMIVYLHGGLGRGDDFAKMSWYPLPRLLREPGRDLPFVVLMPQCPQDDIWGDPDGLLALVDEVGASQAVDPDRIYLVGYSMGGTGAWRVALAHPERFAAVAPMSGYADPSRAPRLRGVPVWVFHGAKDERVSPAESERMVEALEAAGVETRFSLDAERGHSPPSDEDHMRLFEWFSTKSRGRSGSTADSTRR